MKFREFLFGYWLGSNARRFNIFLMTFSFWVFTLIQLLCFLFDRSISGVNNEWFWFLFTLIIFEGFYWFFFFLLEGRFCIYWFHFLSMLLLKFIIDHIFKTWAFVKRLFMMLNQRIILLANILERNFICSWRLDWICYSGIWKLNWSILNLHWRCALISLFYWLIFKFVP